MEIEKPPREVPQTEPETVAKPSKPRHPNSRSHPNTLKNLKRDAGPGRPQGSRNKFSQEAIARFVDQYRADLAADWNKHGAAFVEQCRERLPQIYATMQRMRIEDELSRAEVDNGPIQVTWLQADQADVAPPVAPAPPLQIEYKRPELPGDLSEGDWSKLLQILEVAKRVAPSDALPGDVLEAIRKALLAHYAADQPAPVKRDPPPRGKSGKYLRASRGKSGPKSV
jgi:hypothetical protein